MTLSDSIRDNVNKKKGKKDPKEEVRNGFNHVTLKLLKRFIEDVENGTIQVSDIADVMRLYNMYLNINDLANGDEGTGKLPSLPREQLKLLEDSVTVNKATSEDGEDEVFINEAEFMTKSAEEIQKLLTEREISINNENERMF